MKTNQIHFQALDYRWALLALLLLPPFLSRAQTTTLHNIFLNGLQIQIGSMTGLPAQGCSSVDYFDCEQPSTGTNDPSPPPLPIPCNYVTEFQAINPSNYLVGQKGITYSTWVGFVTNGSCGPFCPYVVSQVSVYYISKVGTPEESTELLRQKDFAPFPGSQTIDSIYYTPLGSPGDLLYFHFEGGYLQGGILIDQNAVNLFIPIVIEGAMQDTVGIIGTATTPQIPFMILHDPPGDGSSSTFASSKKFCRQYSESISEVTSNSSQVEVKVGVAGSAGIFVTQNFEFSFSVSGQFGTEEKLTTANTYETCLESLTTYNTSSAEGDIGRAADYFIGYGYRFFLGEWPAVTYNTSTCTISVDTNLIYAKDPTYQVLLLKTEQEILNDIDTLTLVAANPSNPPNVRDMALNQIQVYEDIIAINDNLYSSDLEDIAALTQVTNTGNSVMETISNTSTQTISTSAVVTFGVGASFTLEFGGSGVNGSTQFTFSKSLETTNTVGQSSSNSFTYILNDDDAGGGNGDQIMVLIERDISFGSPIFKYAPNTQNFTLKTSCPYEGGYRRDQPEITADSPHCPDQDDLKVVSIDSIMGDTLAVPINVCSNSNESRVYSLKTGDLTGQIQIVAPGGFVISNTQHVNFTVNANACVLPQIQFIDYNNSPGVHVYENIQLILYPVCAGVVEEVEADTLVFNLTFGGQGAPAYTDSDCDGIPDLNDVCPFVPNIMDNALDFDGVNDRVSVPALNLNSNTVTFEAWVYPDGAQDSNDGIIFCRNGTNTIAGLTIAPSADKFYYKWGGGNTWTGGPLVRENEWQHVALVIEPTKTTIYHNGVPYVHNNITNNPQPFSGLTFLGRDNFNNSLQFKGILDEVRIWNTARSQYDIRYNLNKKLTGNETNLVAYYDFEVGDACENNTGLTTLPDRTGNGHNGTLLDFDLTGNTAQNGCVSNWRVGRNFEKNSDADNYYNSCDNCPYVANNNQADADGDGVGNVCDACPGFDDHLDTDGDGAPDGCDPCVNGTGTALEIGDIAFTVYSSDNDEFSFTLLRSIDPCTVIRFTDRGWLPYGVFYENTNDRTVTFAAGRGFACGEQITISSSPFVALDESGASAGVLSGKPLTLSENGDQLFAYQGADDPPLWDQSAFLAAINMNGAWTYTTSNGNDSNIPNIFTLGVNELTLTPEVDNAIVICDSMPATDDPNVIFAALMDPHNWFGYDAIFPFTSTPPCVFGCCSESLTLANAYTGVTKLFEASDNITSSDMIAGNSDIDYSSGNDIDILPNFSVELGSEFHAFIAGCLLPFPIQAPKSSTALQAPGNSILEVKGVADITPTQKEVGFVLAKKADVQMALLDQAMQPTGIEITMPGLEGGTYTQSVFLDQPGKDYFLQIIVDGKVVASKIKLK